VARKKIVIAGARVAGLTLAYELCKSGHDVTLIEKEASAGGLARSFTYEGGYTFDAGPHRFYTESASVLGLINDVLKDDILTMPRKSGVRMFDRYFEWPLRFVDIFRMPLRECISVALDMLKRSPQPGDSFESYILASYGRTLYDIFFQPYTEKFLRLPCTDISKHWALTGIDRAVIDSSINVNNLSSLARSLFNPKAPLQFIYPQSGGIGVFAEKLQRKIEKLGGRVVLGAGVSAVRVAGGAIDRVTAGGEQYDCETLVWTAPLPELTGFLGLDPFDLSYLSLVIYNFEVTSQIRPEYQWCYFGAEDVPFNRISYPTLFNPDLAPPGGTGICVEVTCRTGESVWQSPEAMLDPIIAAMVANKVIGSRDEIRGCHVERVGGAYPINTLDYETRLSGALAQLGRIEGVELLGRTGRFWYNNMDHSIEDALALAARLNSQVRG
jgi:protoporphyrinogen oxidase